MSDPQNFGLGELGQRVQAMGDPVPEPRLRPYQGGSQPGSVSGNGSSARTVPAWKEMKPDEAVPTVKPATPVPPYTSYYSTPTAYSTPTIPAPPEPYPPLGPAAVSSNGSSNGSFNGSSGPSTASTAGSYTSAASSSAPPAPEDPNAPKSGLQRAVDAVRSALPLVQRLLPLLEGSFANTVTALVTPHAAPHPVAPHPPAPPPPPPAQVHVDLEPVERGLAEVRSSHRELRSQVAEQNTSLKRVEDQLDHVREATDRNTLEQQELVEDLRAVGNRISAFAIVGVVLLLISLGLNIYFLVQLQHILR
jgi:hypothetical protein